MRAAEAERDKALEEKKLACEERDRAVQELRKLSELFGERGGECAMGKGRLLGLPTPARSAARFDAHCCPSLPMSAAPSKIAASHPGGSPTRGTERESPGRFSWPPTPLGPAPRTPAAGQSPESGLAKSSSMTLTQSSPARRRAELNGRSPPKVLLSPPRPSSASWTSKSREQEEDRKVSAVTDCMQSSSDQAGSMVDTQRQQLAMANRKLDDAIKALHCAQMENAAQVQQLTAGSPQDGPAEGDAVRETNREQAEPVCSGPRINQSVSEQHLPLSGVFAREKTGLIGNALYGAWDLSLESSQSTVQGVVVP